jgi:formate dehydrogenase subunit beta
MEVSLEIQGGAEAAVRGLLRRLLDSGLSRGVLVPVKLPFGHGVTPALVRDPARLDDAVPLAQVMPVSEATLAGALTAGGEQGPLAVVLRPCQIRAYVELVKLQQAARTDVLVIGIDCPGTYEVADYVRLVEDAADPAAEWIAGLRTGQPAPHAGYAFREACRICERPLPDGADLRVRIVDVNDAATLRVQGTEEVLSRLGLSEPGPEAVAGAATRRLIDSRTAERDLVLGAFHERVQDVTGLLAELSTCIRCLNCMTACPLCYCKECIFRTETFSHRPADYERWAGRKGAVRLPPDTLLFHLTRLNHMSVSCVGCGLCESACPNDLPVARLFRAVGERVQALFDYVPGRDPGETIPIATFREDELE